MHIFEDLVLQGLKECSVQLAELVELNKKNESIPKTKIGVGVSGGADSVSLLLALCQIAKSYNISLYVITVNHFMREESLSNKDADFVLELGQKLQKQNKIEKVVVKKLEKNSVQNLSKQEKIGLEAAARVLRYNAFEEFINQNNLSYFCLAHNQNDQIETVLMRIFSGSFIDSRKGIPLVRDKYIRPLLNVSRKQIEEYLKFKKQDYCTDASNFEENFERNKIRLKLIPFLDKEFASWKNGILSCAKKDELDYKTINQLTEKEFLNVTKYIQNTNEICIDLHRFLILQENIQYRILLKAINHLSNKENKTRIPIVFLEDLLQGLKQKNNQNLTKNFSDNQFFVKNNILFIKKSQNLDTKMFFSVIIEEDCKIDFSFGKIECISCINGSKKIVINGQETQIFIEYPFCIRNAYLNDFIITSEKKEKSVSKIFTDWKVRDLDKNKLLVVQELLSKNQQLVCILGKYCGFKDWVVKY